MHNFYITAVRYGMLTMDKVPTAYREEVKKTLFPEPEPTPETVEELDIK